MKAGYKQGWQVGQRQTWKAKFKIFDPSHFKLLKFIVPVGIPAMQNCAMTFTSQSRVFCPVSGVQVEDPGAPCTSDKEKLSILEPPFSAFVLGSWLPAGVGGGDSPSAKAGVVGSLLPQQHVHGARFCLLVWTLACPGVCYLSPYPITKLFL